MIKVGVVGDTHGNMNWLVGSILPWAVKNGVTHLVQVGDFGFVWRSSPEYPRNIIKLNRKLVESGIVLYFLPGNHEDHDELALLIVESDESDYDEQGFFMVADNIRYLGRHARWEWGGCRFAAVGGAPSIDKGWRIKQQGSARTLWWPEEVLSEQELLLARAGDPVDVLFTHDAPEEFNMKHMLKANMESDMHRREMSRVGRALRPSFWFHGHYHYACAYRFQHDLGIASVMGLPCDGEDPTRAAVTLSPSSIREMRHESRVSPDMTNSSGGSS